MTQILYLLIPLFLFNLRGTSQEYRNPLHGSLIIALICEDCIIIAADSRGSITEKLPSGVEEGYAYIDSIQKIFILKNYPLAITGTTMLKDKYFVDLISKYNKKKDKGNSFQSVFNDFEIFLLKKYKISKQTIFNDNSYITGFYENLKPKVIGFNKSDSLV